MRKCFKHWLYIFVLQLLSILFVKGKSTNRSQITGWFLHGIGWKRRTKELGYKSSEPLVPHPFGFPFQDAGSVAWLRPPLHHRPGTVLCGSMHSVRPGLHAPHTFIPFFYENRSEKNKNKKHRRLEICVRMHVRLRVWLWLRLCVRLYLCGCSLCTCLTL